jgi:cell division septal protein FtsQ
MLFSGKKNRKAINPLGPSERDHRPKNKLTIGKFFYWAALLSFTGVTMYVLFFSQFLTITDVKVQGTEKIDGGEIKEDIFSALEGKYLNFLPKNNIILANRKELSQFLSSQFRLIESLKIEKSFPNSLAILVKEKTPLLIMRSGSNEYVIDDKGIAYEKSDFESDFLRENKLIILDDSGGKQIAVKSEALRPDYINFILDVKDKLNRYLDIGINQVVRVSSIVSGDMTVETDGGWKIYLNKNVGAEKELEMLKVVLDNKIEKDKRGDLEYVDLRTDNKVYYKFKNTEQKSGD